MADEEGLQGNGRLGPVPEVPDAKPGLVGLVEVVLLGLAVAVGVRIRIWGGGHGGVLVGDRRRRVEFPQPYPGIVAPGREKEPSPPLAVPAEGEARDPVLVPGKRAVADDR